MHNVRLGQRIVLQIRFEAFPCKRAFLAPPIKPLKYQLLRHMMVVAFRIALQENALPFCLEMP